MADANNTQYFWCILLPGGEELQIMTRTPIPWEVCAKILACEILAAQVYPRRLDANG